VLAYPHPYINDLTPDMSPPATQETAQGVIAGSFMGGYCVFSPIFAYLSTVFKPFTLMGLGLAAWCIACALATVAPSFGCPPCSQPAAPPLTARLCCQRPQLPTLTRSRAHTLARAHLLGLRSHAAPTRTGTQRP
jgi:MFS family permease